MAESNDGGTVDTTTTPKSGGRQLNGEAQPGLPRSNDGGTLDTGTKTDKGVGEE